MFIERQENSRTQKMSIEVRDIEVHDLYRPRWMSNTVFENTVDNNGIIKPRE